MVGSAITDILGMLQRLMIIIIVALTLLQVVPGFGSQFSFLIASLCLVGFAFLNLIVCQYQRENEYIGVWRIYALFLFLAMVFGSIGDFALPGLFFFPTNNALINGILYFGLGHVLYLLAMRNRAPFLFHTNEKRTLLLRNLAIWMLSITFAVTLFMLTVYNPADQVMSIGALGYAILLITAVAFSITFWFSEFSPLFKLSIAFGFVFFFLSDWVIAIRSFRDASFLSGTAFVGVTYLIGQLLIQATTFIAASLVKQRSEPS
ncbi:MAG: lysoplasmalogenase family protein [Candidatus Thorarchaeota archaeon]